MVTISQLQRAHIERQEEWCPDQKPDLSFRGNEMAGETGEACNVIKKLERERHGWRGSRDTHVHLGEELADVIHTAILCAITAGIELEPYVADKFNETSRKNGLSTFLAPEPQPVPIAELEAFVAETRDLIEKVTFDESGKMVAGLWVGGNGGLLQRETLHATDVLRRRLETIAALVAAHQKD